MLTNLLHPWLIARLLSGASAAALTLYGAFVAMRVLRHWRAGATSEGQLALERRAELVATIVQAALWISVFNLALTVLAADRLTGVVRGAMCAWGVFDASPFGFASLGASAIVAAGCGLWLTLHRLDLRLPKPVLTRRKLGALLFLTPLVVLDFALFAAFALGLDLKVVASCCSLGLDAAVPGSTAAAGPRDLAAMLALGAAIMAAALALATRARPRPMWAWSASIASALAATLAIPAIVWFVAPYAYQTPTHLCPFCLLHADVLGMGWPLFGALGLAAITGVGLAVVEAHRPNAPREVETLERKLSTFCAGAWLVVIAIGAAPVVSYAWASGGATLFGGT